MFRFGLLDARDELIAKRELLTINTGLLSVCCTAAHRPDLFPIQFVIFSFSACERFSKPRVKIALGVGTRLAGINSIL